MRKRTIFAVMATGIVAMPGPGAGASGAAPLCGERDKLISSLHLKYSEEPVAAGVTSNGGVIEVLKAPDGQTWTILFTYPAGPSCLIASGEAWQEIEAQLAAADPQA